MDYSQYFEYGVAILVVSLFSVYQYVQALRRQINLPAVGYSGTLTSYITGFQYLLNAKKLIEEGVAQYGTRPFKIASLGRWNVIVTGKDYIEEYRRVSEEVLSLDDAANEALATRYTLGPAIEDNMYHVGIIKTNLTRNLPAVVESIADELALAIDEIIPTKGNEWTAVPMYDTVKQIISRTSNRAFVGLPVCRDPDYNDIAIKITMDVIFTANIVNLFPQSLKPLAGFLFSRVRKTHRRTVKHLTPVIEERRRMYEQHGKDWPGKPADLLTWLMEEAVGEETTVDALASRILALNFASVHTTTMIFTQTIYYLAANPQYADAMREETKRVLDEEGWTKGAMNKLHKIDSFIKESHRLTGISTLTMSRIARKDFTFSDGTFVPKGSSLFVAPQPMQFDEEVYEDPHEFKPFRFAELREEAGEALKHSSATTSANYLGFGHGKLACPGRFFVVHEMQAMLAYIVLHYDIKTEIDGVRPENIYFNTTIIPNTKAKILFRKRTN